MAPLLSVGVPSPCAYHRLTSHSLFRIPINAPSVAIEILGAPHFAKYAPGEPMPPSEAVVGKVSLLHVCELVDAWSARSE